MDIYICICISIPRCTHIYIYIYDLDFYMNSPGSGRVQRISSCLEDFKAAVKAALDRGEYSPIGGKGSSLVSIRTPFGFGARFYCKPIYMM